MSNQFAQDLRLARRKAGLTQDDVALLVGTQQSAIGAMEKGTQMPSVDQVCLFSLIFGRSFESLFAQSLERGRSVLRENMPCLPAKRQHSAETFNRGLTLKRLELRLSEKSPSV